MKFNNHIWFLDHLGINHQIKYIGKWEKKDYLLYQTILKNKLDEYCYQNGFEKHMIKNIKPITKIQTDSAGAGTKFCDGDTCTL